MTQEEQPPRQVGIQSNSGGDIDIEQSQVNIAGRDIHIHTPSIPRPGSAPPLPALIVGREDDLRNLKARLVMTLGGQETSATQVLTAMRGWPGVGKTTMVAALAHDPEIADAFPDGVLWTSLGQTPSILSELAAWGRALDTDNLLSGTVEEASARLTARLRNKRMFSIFALFG